MTYILMIQEELKDKSLIIGTDLQKRNSIRDIISIGDPGKTGNRISV